ncbi:MAG: hypothetical protein IPI38_07735 [Gemmatimonadetes bacterium]|nr:hypothetical protein [Gemmatimonadota bacterium]
MVTSTVSLVLCRKTSMGTLTALLSGLKVLVTRARVSAGGRTTVMVNRSMASGATRAKASNWGATRSRASPGRAGPIGLSVQVTSSRAARAAPQARRARRRDLVMGSGGAG